MKLFKPRAIILRNLACLLPQRMFDLNLVICVFLKSVNTDSLRWRVLARVHADVRRVAYNTNRSTKSGLMSAVLGESL